MSILFKQVTTNRWVNSKSMLCIPCEDIKYMTKEELNNYIETYIIRNGVYLYKTNFVTAELYISIKFWASKDSSGYIGIGIMEIPNYISFTDFRPLRAAEIIMLSKNLTDKECEPIYTVISIATDSKYTDSVMLFNPDTVKHQYSLRMPIINLEV